MTHSVRYFFYTNCVVEYIFSSHHNIKKILCCLIYLSFSLLIPVVLLWALTVPEITRSQAVARIANRTAKNCRSHVT